MFYVMFFMAFVSGLLAGMYLMVHALAERNRRPGSGLSRLIGSLNDADIEEQTDDFASTGLCERLQRQTDASAVMKTTEDQDTDR